MVFERNTHTTLRALNFIESVLQIWKARDDQDFLLVQFRMSITRAVKFAMQAQVSSFYESIQLRRDHHLSVAKELSTDDIQLLRHSPLLGLPLRFLDATLPEIDVKFTKCLTTKALLQSTTKKKW